MPVSLKKVFSLVDQSLGSGTARNLSNDTVDNRSPTGPRAFNTRLGNNEAHFRNGLNITVYDEYLSQAQLAQLHEFLDFGVF